VATADLSRAAHSRLSIIHESAGNDAAASFQRAGYQGCRISPPDLAMALMAVVHAAHPKLLRNAVPKSGIWRIARGTNRPLRRWFPASLKSAASPWFAGQSNIDRPERHFGRNPPGLCCVNMTSWNEQY
jgi:hypothetical protein